MSNIGLFTYAYIREKLEQKSHFILFERRTHMRARLVYKIILIKFRIQLGVSTYIHTSIIYARLTQNQREKSEVFMYIMKVNCIHARTYIRVCMYVYIQENFHLMFNLQDVYINGACKKTAYVVKMYLYIRNISWAK